MRRLRSIAAIALLVISSLLISALSLEAWLAIEQINTKSIAQFVPGKGTTYVPGAYYRHVEEGYSEGYINSYGFRDYERTYEKPKDTFRILVLGNSYTEAFQVALQDSFPAVLERRLNSDAHARKFEVLNLGQSGFGTGDEYVRYVNFGAKFSPDIVILAFVTAADIRTNSKFFNTELSYFFDMDQEGNVTLDDSRFVEYGKTYSFTKRAFQTLKQHSFLASLLSEWVFRLRFEERQQSLEATVSGNTVNETRGKVPESSGLNVYLPEMSEHWKDAFAVTEAGLRKIKEAVEANGSQFMLVTLTNPEQIHPDVGQRVRESYDEDFDFDLPDRIIGEYAEREGMNHLELAPGFREYHLRTGEYLHGFGSGKGGHWNEKGHHLAAEKIREYLKQKYGI